MPLQGTRTIRRTGAQRYAAAAFLPLSINGIGLMEESFVAMAVALGVDYDQALLVAIVRRLMIAFLSLLCGLVYLLEGRPRLPFTSAPELHPH